jgi:LacI family transcriptional regulator
VETSNSYARGLLHGIRDYMREHRSWSLYIGEQRRGEPAPEWFRQWKGDGVIARIESAAIARAVAQSGLPAVNVSAGRFHPEVPMVETNDAAVARLAAEHFLERGFRNFGFCGDARFNWSCLREENFHRIVGEAGFACSTCPSPRSRVGDIGTHEGVAMGEWLRQLPKPAGVMAAYDVRGRELLSVCRDLGIAVPDEVGVIGAGNDALFCDLADPPLSSVILDATKSGYEAARLLDALMSGQTVPPGVLLIQPLGIVTRASTDVLATADTDISAVIRFIRAHALEGITVEDVVQATPLSRRVLETRFVKLFGRTVHGEIMRVRVERIKELLAETDLSLTAIAHRVGVDHVEYLSVLFKRQVGLSPSEFRAQRRR